MKHLFYSTINSEYHCQIKDMVGAHKWVHIFSTFLLSFFLCQTLSAQYLTFIEHETTGIDCLWQELSSITVTNPQTGNTESILVTKEGEIEHRPTGGGDIYTDNAIIYKDHNGQNRHATFSSGLWMVRQYNVAGGKAVGPYLKLNSVLDYSFGTIKYRAYVQNSGAIASNVNTFIPLGDQFEVGIFGLPLQFYKNQKGWKNNTDGILTGSVFTYELGGWRFLGDYANFQSSAFMESLAWGTSFQPAHVLPAESNTFTFEPRIAEIFNCATVGSNFTCIYGVADNPTELVNLLTPIETAVRRVDGDRTYFEFDIGQFDLDGGLYFIALTLLEDGEGKLNLRIPVILEKSVGPLNPFTEADGTTKSEITGPVEISMVLHDPPGDASFATYEIGTEVCTTFEYAASSANNSNYDNAVQVGFSGSAGTDAISVNIETTVRYTNTIEKTSTVLSNNSMEECTSLTSSISTNDANGFFDNGDVYIGHSNIMNLYSGQRIYWDEDDGSYEQSEGLYFDIIEQVKFEKDQALIETEINQLKIDIENITQGANEDDDTFALRRDFMIQTMETLYEMITENKAILSDPSITPEVPGTLNVLSGAATATETLASVEAQSNTYEVLTTKNHTVDETILVAGNGYVGSQAWGTTKSSSNTFASVTSNTTSNTYVLEDDVGSDIEKMEVTQHVDPRFGNRFFRVTPDSRTSCTYEGGLRTELPNVKSRIPAIYPNESNQIYISGAPAGQALTVDIDLCNLFEFDDQNVTGYFVLDFESGTGGNASVETNNGVELSGRTYNFDYGNCFGEEQPQQFQQVVITPENSESICYSNENNNAIRLRLCTSCGGPFDMGGERSGVCDVLNISICFTTDPNEPLNMNAECAFLEDTDHAMNFDGVDDRIELDVQKQPFLFNDFTYEFWVKPDKPLVSGQVESNTIGSQSAASTNGNFPFVVFPENANELYQLPGYSFGAQEQVMVGIAVGTDGVQVVEHFNGIHDGNVIIHSPVVLNYATSLDDWTHVAVVYKKRKPTLYINGEFAKVGLMSEFLGVHPGLQLGGGEVNGTQNYFGGTIDEFRVWSYARAQPQILQDKNNSLTGAESEMLLLYRFDGQQPGVNNAGQGLVDYTGRLDNDNAVLYNFDYGSNSSNWVIGRVSEFCASCPESLDPDGDALTDCEDLCPNDRDVSLHFDGSNTDYVEVPNVQAFNLTDGDFAFEAWINPTSDGYKTIVSKGDGGGGGPTSYIFGIMADDDTFFNQPGKLGLSLTAGTSEWQFSNTSIPQDAWTHVAVSVDNSGANPVATFYYNGSVDGVKTFPFSNLYNGDTNSFFIGRQGSGCQCNHFDGRMDELAVWDKTLSTADVTASMATPYSGSKAALVAYYDFNDADACVSNGGNTTLSDLANGHDGALTNFNLSTGCTSNWTSGHNKGSCPTTACPPSLDLTSTQNSNQVYASGGYISSAQTINSPAQVDYDARTEITLLENFEVKAGSIFHAFIDGCANAFREIKEMTK